MMMTKETGLLKAHVEFQAMVEFVQRAKIEWRRGGLFPRVDFLVTNLSWQSPRVVRFYKGRGTAQPWIKEGANAVSGRSSPVARSRATRP